MKFAKLNLLPAQMLTLSLMLIGVPGTASGGVMFGKYDILHCFWVLFFAMSLIEALVAFVHYLMLRRFSIRIKLVRTFMTTLIWAYHLFYLFSLIYMVLATITIYTRSRFLEELFGFIIFILYIFSLVVITLLVSKRKNRSVN